MNPQLIKYARETDISIALSRKESRPKLFVLFPPLAMHLKSPNPSQDQVEPFKEVFGHRVFLKCESIKMKLQVVDDKDNLCQVEPYYTTLCLYDVRNGRKLTEHFHFDVNSDSIRTTLVTNQHSATSSLKLDILEKVLTEWLSYPRNGLCSIANPHPDIFLFVRIEKVLQGGISQSSDPYVKASYSTLSEPN